MLGFLECEVGYIQYENDETNFNLNIYEMFQISCTDKAEIREFRETIESSINTIIGPVTIESRLLEQTLYLNFRIAGSGFRRIFIQLNMTQRQKLLDITDTALENLND